MQFLNRLKESWGIWYPLLTLRQLFKSKSIRRIQAINDTKIKYLSVVNKIYEVVSINWLQLYLEARETDLAADDVPENELWDISFFKDFRIRLVSGGDGAGMGDVVDFKEWVERNKGWCYK